MSDRDEAHAPHGPRLHVLRFTLAAIGAAGAGCGGGSADGGESESIMNSFLLATAGDGAGTTAVGYETIGILPARPPKVLVDLYSPGMAERGVRFADGCHIHCGLHVALSPQGEILMTWNSIGNGSSRFTACARSTSDPVGDRVELEPRGVYVSAVLAATATESAVLWATDSEIKLSLHLAGGGFVDPPVVLASIAAGETCTRITAVLTPAGAIAVAFVIEDVAQGSSLHGLLVDPTLGVCGPVELSGSGRGVSTATLARDATDAIAFWTEATAVGEQTLFARPILAQTSAVPLAVRAAGSRRGLKAAGDAAGNVVVAWEEDGELIVIDRDAAGRVSPPASLASGTSNWSLAVTASGDASIAFGLEPANRVEAWQRHPGLPWEPRLTLETYGSDSPAWLARDDTGNGCVALMVLGQPTLVRLLPPSAQFDVSAGPYPPGTTIDFDANRSESRTPQCGLKKFEWDLDGDGLFETSGPTVFRRYLFDANVHVQLRVTDEWGATDVGAKDLVIGNGG